MLIISFLFSFFPARTASVFSLIRSLANLLITFRVRRKRMCSFVGTYCTNARMGIGMYRHKWRKRRVSLDGNGMASALWCAIRTVAKHRRESQSYVQHVLVRVHNGVEGVVQCATLHVKAN